MVKSVRIKEKTYEVEDPTQFFLDLFSFRRENQSHFPNDHWELVLGAIVGGMGSGKSTLLQFITALGQKIYGDELRAFHTDSIIATLKTLNEKPKLRSRVLFLYLDDAITKPGSDSRRSMGAENVKESQNLSIIRHLLANEDENGKADPRFSSGFCVIIYAVQDLNRLDAFVRRNLHFAIYKTYYETLEKELDTNSVQFLKEVTEDSMYRHNYGARGYCILKTLTGAILKLYIPKTELSIDKLYSDGPNYGEIIEHVLKLDLDEVKDTILRGYIREYCTENKIKLDPSEINEIIEISRYQQWKIKNQQGKSQEDRLQNCDEEINRRIHCATIHELLAQGKTLEQISKKISKTKSWIDYNYKKWCNEMGIKPIRIKKIRKKLKEMQKILPTEEEDE